LENGPKVIHFGRTPVDAITLAFEMMDDGLLTIGFDNRVQLTEKGREFLEGVK
jgi:predicted methyltransferase